MNVLLPLLFQLSFSGFFNGTGKAIFPKGKTYHCRDIFLNLRTTSKTFNLREGGYNCGDLLTASFNPFEMTIKDGVLVSNGKIMGRISENELSYEVYDPTDNSTYRLTLEVLPQGLKYLEEWYDEGRPALVIEGNLQKNNLADKSTKLKD